MKEVKNALSLNMNKKLKKKKQFKENFVAYLFLMPWLLGLVIFTLWPILQSLAISFTRYDVFSPMRFIGIQNFTEMFSDKLFIKSIIVTSRYVFLSVPLKLAFALFVAVLLEKNIRGMNFHRTVYYLPSLIGGSVAIAVIWRKIFGLDGLFNSFLSLLGIQGKEWLGSPDHALNMLVLLTVWQFGSSMVIFLAGLKNVPGELYDAANVDGANKIRKFTNITLPMLSPIILFNLIMQVIGSFQVFTQGYIITKGGPMNETLFAVLYIYQKAFQAYRMGYSSAMSWVLLFIIAIVAGMIFKTSKYWVFYESEPAKGKTL